MQIITFTESRLKTLRPKDKPYEIRDAGCRGLRLRVTSAGSKVFLWTGRIDGKQKQFTLGHYPGLGLSDARQKLLSLKSQSRNGTLKPDKQLKAEEKSEAEKLAVIQKADSITLGEVLDIFEKTVISKRKTPKSALQVINAELRQLSHMPLKSVTSQDIQNHIYGIINRGAAQQAGATLAIFKHFFNWCDAADYCINPISSLNNKFFAIPACNKQEVILDIDSAGRPIKGLPEINRLLKLLESEEVVVKNGIKLLLLTGVRTSELLQAEKGHITGNEWYIPGENVKTGKAITIPLSNYALSLFNELPSGEKIFTCSTQRHNVALKRLCERHNLGRITAHSLRKTMRTHIGHFTSHEIAETCINHTLGGENDTYNKASFLEERREVLLRWSDLVEGRSNILELVV